MSREQVAAVRGLKRSHALPADVELAPVYDQAELVDESLTSVRDAILIGIALSLIVIALALRDVRAGLIAAIPVPLTLLGTFAVVFMNLIVDVAYAFLDPRVRYG